MLSLDWTLNAFEAASEGPPKRKLYIWQDEPVPANAAPNVVSGWGFSVSEFDEVGDPQPFWDTWERTFEEILRYPPEYAPRDIVWTRIETGEVVNLYEMASI
ncbi:MAG: hypothetical protein AB7O98_14010 [Hyphomonadaceae bacterium]